MNPRHLAFATRERLHQNDLLAHVAEYRAQVIARRQRPKRVHGVYNQNGYLVNWSLSKKGAETQAEKLRWDHVKITVKIVP